MDISRYAVGPESYDKLSTYQISQFFERHKRAKRNGFNSHAADILASTVSPTPMQGGSSYTVKADSNRVHKVVQFRYEKLDMKAIEQARQSYPDFIPVCESHSVYGDVFVYVWNLVPGPAFCRVRRQFLAPGMEQQLRRTVQDFAKFFASAWINRPIVEKPLDLFEEYSDIIDQLYQRLPIRFQPKLDEIRRGLPLLFRPSYPVVIQHDDLLENNIHVDEASGHITGIVDWASPIVAPFGVSLGGLETILGVQTSAKWHFHPNHMELRKHFWNTLYEEIGQVSEDDRCSIEIARLFGLFRTYGFDDKLGIINLEAFCVSKSESESI
ncbi:uncharacterized protein F4822DRAFT_429788 [Hypoxylon trugodes]|uniref:uncharacterized protein n=1 Tax=Hypoxylon trugodes TaxID=326681 RepID=UPI0021A0C2FC|nr:uncharacterized protein F4822DRAFT_429788 [Hypoxylon trugodes]KAI1389175.1 hypothetical protein F4822DRAFT_429788 [Hypoxylon trugodes]